MIQYFIFGASMVYGVGGENGGWADILKQKLHERMYREGGVGERYELYNFSKPGATVDFVQATYKDQVKNYRRDNKIIALVSIGGNNSKAIDQPTNYVSTPEEYEEQIRGLLKGMKSTFDRVLFIGAGFVDESKTNPKTSPFREGKSFFTNERRKIFDDVLESVCRELEVELINPDMPQEEWIRGYLFEDGLHPNDAGHRVVAKKVWQEVRPEKLENE